MRIKSGKIQIGNPAFPLYLLLKKKFQNKRRTEAEGNTGAFQLSSE